jgi:hypothetical protein
MKHGSYFGTFACALVIASASFAQLPSTQLTAVFPPGGKQGTSVEVTVSGADMDDVDRLLFNHGGITATPKMAAPSDLMPTPQPVPGAFTVQIAGDVPPGMYEVRAMGRFGLSNPRTFAVGTLNEASDASGNNSLDKAIELPVGNTLSGRVDASNFDFVRVNLKQGERVIIDCAAERLDSRMDPTLVVVSPAGKEIVRVRDTVGRDPVLDFTAPAEGSYVLKLYDAVYGGGNEHVYRLSVSSAPFVDYVFPPSGPVGSNNQYTLYGRNLPGGQPADGLLRGGVPLQKLQVTIPIPADEPSITGLALGLRPEPQRVWQDGIVFALPTPQGNANPVTVYVARAPVALEQEPNNDGPSAQKVTLPCEYVGQFHPQRDVDWLQFDAKKGEVYRVEVMAHQLGLQADPFLAIFRVTKNDKGEEQLNEVAQDDDGENTGGRRGRRDNDRNNRSEFDTSNSDPSILFTAPDDGIYRVMVRDQIGDSRVDPAFVYRLAIAPPQPDFRLLAYPTPQSAGQQDNNRTGLAAVTLRKGGTAAVGLELQRRDDFEGEVNVSVEGLPPGVTCAGAVLGGEVTRGSLVFVAAESAAAWAGPVKIVAKGKIGDREVVREARYGSVVWGTQNRQQQPAEYRLCRAFQLGLIDREAEPAFVQIGEDKVYETSLGGNVEIPLTLTRRGDFKEAIKLVGVGLSDQMKPKEVNLDANATAGKFELQLNQQNAKPGTYTFFMKGETKRKYVRNPDAVPAAEAEQKAFNEMHAKLMEAAKTATTVKDQTTKAAQDVAAAAKTAEQKKTEAANNAKAKADAAKQAADKLAQAKEAAVKDAANQGLADAAKAAETAANEAAAAQKKADEDLAASDKALTDAQAAAKTADEAKVAAEAALKAAQDKVTQANQMKQQIDKKVNDAKQANQPKDVQFAIISTPIKLKVAASPFNLTATAPAGPVKQEQKSELPIKIERLYGFADQVEFTLEPPQGVQGLSAPKVTLNKDQAEGKLEVAAAGNATVGQHKCTVRARGRFNNVQVETTSEVLVTVEAK